MVKGYIYRHWIINEDGIEKSYIGQTISKPNKRWDKGRGYTRNGKTNKFANAIEKYGWNNFHHEIIGIVENISKEQLILDLNEWEIYYINKYDSFYNGYNMTLGGAGSMGYVPNEETKKKLSDKLSGEFNPMYGKRHNEKTKKKMSENHADVTGEKNPNYGKEAYNRRKVVCLTTKEVFNSLEEAQERYGCSSTLSLCCQGKRKSCGKHPETGEKLVWAYKDDYDKMNEEEIKKRLDVHHKGKKTIICLETLEVFDSSNYASRKYNIDNSSILRCCKGKYKTAGNYHWMFYDDYLKLHEK